MGDSALEHWVHFLHALPFPAALVDGGETLIEANHLVAIPDDGRLLVRAEAGHSTRRSRAGTDGKSRWRLTPLGEHGSVQLVTAEGDSARSHLLEAFFATGDALFVVFDPNGIVLAANDAWTTTLGYDRDHILGLDAWTLVEPTDRDLHQRDIGQEAVLTGRSERMLRVIDADGGCREMHWTFYFDPEIDRSFGIGRDVTEERERERILKDSHRTFEQVGEFLLAFDAEGVLLSANPALFRTFEIVRADLIGRTATALVHPDDWPRLLDAASEARSGLVATEPLTRWRGPDQAEWRWVDGTISFDQEYQRYHLVARDVTAEYELTAELERRAYTDELTGLANRARLIDTLNEYLTEPWTPAVLFCDLDRFKVVNDSLGHRVGDELLRQLGSRLERQSSSEDSLVARIGGDEFVVLLGDADEKRAVAAAEELLELMSRPFMVDGRELYAAMSVGITLARPGTGIGPGRNPGALLGEADTAGYEAKELGRARYAIHDDRMRSEAQRRFDVESGLRRAIDNDGFDVAYQPIVAIPGGGIVGIEALVRWPAEDGRLRLPGEFLDVAKDAGLIDKIVERVLATALRDGARLAEHGRNLIVSVNVAASQLADPAFASSVVAETERTGFAAENLLVELTESAILANNEATVGTLMRLRESGIRVGLDDFGTGFSSLSHLQNLPIDVVKIDRSFVAAIDDEVTRAVTSSVISLCDVLGLDVVLEGIETADQLSAVEQLGATIAQGYFFHRPMPVSELEDLLGMGPRHGPVRTEVQRRTS